MENYYQLFGINRNDNYKLKELYHELMRKYHPDSPGGSDIMAAKVIDMYNIFSDSIKKKAYDLKIDIYEEKLKLMQICKNNKLSPNLKKYYIAFKNTITDFYKYSNVDILQIKLDKCKYINKLFIEEINKSNKKQPDINNNISNNDLNNKLVNTVVPNTKINPINWYEQYKQEIKNDSSLTAEQSTELINYVDQLKSEFMRLFVSYASIEHTKEDINEAINNTIKLVKMKKYQLLNIDKGDDKKTK